MMSRRLEQVHFACLDRLVLPWSSLCEERQEAGSAD